MEAGRKSEPLIKVLEKWGEKALNANDPDFQTWRFPNVDQLRAFTEFTGRTHFKKVLTEFVQKAGGECARPITAPNGLAWSEWFTDQQ